MWKQWRRKQTECNKDYGLKEFNCELKEYCESRNDHYNCITEEQTFFNYDNYIVNLKKRRF